MKDAMRLVRVVLPAILVLAGAAGDARAQTGTEPVSPGTLLAYSTIYSVGVEWDVLDDSDHDATAGIEYRAGAASEWRSAGSLVRVDFNGRNMLAGSVLFLTPGTTYQVRITLSDPDGGGETRTVTVATRPLPVAPAGGRVFYVMPGAGGGNGSPEAPFGGIAVAEVVAQPGDTFLLHAGSYGGRIRFTRPGTAAAYVAWKALGDGDVVMDGVDVAASHIWLEGLTIANEPPADPAIQTYGMLTSNAPTNVVVTRCRFLAPARVEPNPHENYHDGIFFSGGGSAWYIADNTILGNTPLDSGSFVGEGIDLNVTNGHTVAHNRITGVADGISYPRMNVDIFGNDIFDTSDDGLELDFGLANVRVWGNRIHNALHNAVSFQPQDSGPWYILRNQIVGSVEAAFKFRTTDRLVLLHNTIVHWGTAWPGTSMMCCNEEHLLRAFARNNLWISVQGGQIWGFDAFARDWRSDLDYDGFDWGDATNPFTYGGQTYSDVWSFANASGLETHGIRVAATSRDGTPGCFEDFQVPGPSPAPVPPHVMTLQPWCNAIDAGAVLPGINDGFSGNAPDMGAHEYGSPLPSYGPRAVLAVPEAPSVLTATAVSSAQIDLRWTDNSTTEAGFRIERSLDAQTFAIIGSLGADTVAYSDTTVSAATQYFYRISAHNDAGVSGHSNIASATTSPSGESWTSGDIGAVGQAGSAAVSNGTWTVRGSGADIWDTADEFQYVFQSVSGDFDVVTRVASVEYVDRWTKAGLMLRSSIAAGSAHASLFATPSALKGVSLQTRNQSNGPSTEHARIAAAPPVWLKLMRRGDTVQAAWRTAANEAWVDLPPVGVELSDPVLVGLAVSSHLDGILATATFDNFEISTPPPPQAWHSTDIGAVAAAGSATIDGTTFTVNGSGADIWDTADEFHYAFRSFSGDFDAVARVASVEYVDRWTKAGLMVRGDLSPGAAHASLFATPSTIKGISYQSRSAAGSTSVEHARVAVAAPVWLKLARRGSMVTAAYRLAAADPWTELPSSAIAIEDTVYVGLAVSSHVDGTIATAVFDSIVVTPYSPPASLIAADVGAVGAAGNTTYDGSTFSVAGAGADIWGTADEFHWSYTALAGDFDVTARVADVEHVHRWTKAGLMIRETLAAGSRHASVFATPTAEKGLAFQARPTTGGISVSAPGPAIGPPVWLRLRRVGDDITAWYRTSSTGTWTAIGTQQLTALAAVVHVGLAVTSHVDGTLATAHFDQVELTEIVP